MKLYAFEIEKTADGADKIVTEGAEAEVFLDIWKRIKAQVDAAYAP